MLEEWRRGWQRSVDCHHDLPALLSPAGMLNFGQLADAAQRWRAHYEQQADWRVGRCVALPWRTPHEDLPRLLGIWLAGGAWIALPAGSAMADLADELAAVINGPDGGAGTWHSILCSSGSTGQPKLLVRGWRQALQEAKANATHLNLPAGSRCLMLVNPWFGASSKHLLAGLLQGWCQAIGAEALPLLQGEGDLLYGTPSQLQGLGAAPRGTRGFQWLSLTGEGCPRGLWPLLQSWGQPGARCLNALGASETGVVALQELPLAGPWQAFRGRPAAGKRVVLLDEQGRELHEAGAIGQLQISGDALIEGLLQRHSDGWQLLPTARHQLQMCVLSNDLARWSGAGELELLGRSNHLLKRHGEWVDASPLQHWLEQQPGLRRCQLFADPAGVVAWLELDQPTQARLRRLGRALARTEIEPALHPVRLYGVKQFPLNRNGKIDLASLQADAAETGGHGAVLWEPSREPPILPRLGRLDSLDQAQLLARLEKTNLLWCGGGLQPLAATRPEDVGLLALAFPGAPNQWHCRRGVDLGTLAAEQTEQLLQIAAGNLGSQLWLGGFSLPAWMAYAVALELEQRGQAVSGVILLDPVDPFRTAYRWRWRRRLAHSWRRGAGRWCYHSQSPQRLEAKGWRQELLGEWIGRGGPAPLQSRLQVLSTGRGGQIGLGQARKLHSDLEWHQLNNTPHHQLVHQPHLLEQWLPMVWTTVTQPQGTPG